MEQTYTKLSTLVNDTFKVVKVNGYKFKKWNNEEKKMEISDTKQEGYRKLYQVETNKGILDLGTGQMGTLLEAVFESGLADINLRTFMVKSNGKTGMDIRYYFNPVKESEESTEGEYADEEIPW